MTCIKRWLKEKYYVSILEFRNLNNDDLGIKLSMHDDNSNHFFLKPRDMKK